jgi:hypothetical protein
MPLLCSFVLPRYRVAAGLFDPVWPKVRIAGANAYLLKIYMRWLKCFMISYSYTSK